MRLPNPRELLGREPLQWGRDFCSGMESLFTDPETSPAYLWAFCRQLQKELLPLRRLLRREGRALAGGALVFTEGYPAMRLLLLELLQAGLRREEGQPAAAALGRLQEGLGFMRNLLEDMEVCLQAGPSWHSTVARCLALLVEKGIGPTCCRAPGGRPLLVLALPYRQPASPACYLRDIHGILLFDRDQEGAWKGEEAKNGEEVGDGKGAGKGEGDGDRDGDGDRERTGGKHRARAEDGTGDGAAVVLHEMGHALFARLVRSRGLPAEGPFLLKQCLREAARRARMAGVGEPAGPGCRHAPRRFLAENFCHALVRFMLAEPKGVGETPVGSAGKNAAEGSAALMEEGTANPLRNGPVNLPQP